MQKKEIVDYLKSRKKYLLFSIGFTVFCVLFFNLFSERYMFAYTRKDHVCLPYSFWFIQKKVMPERDEYIAFQSQGVPNFQDGVKWVKILSGMPGDEITFKSKEMSEVMFSDGVGMVRVPVRGYVFLHSFNGKTQEFRVLKADTRGNVLPLIEPQVIPQSKYFVTSPAPKSYDSRYWGLVDSSLVIGKATPIW